MIRTETENPLNQAYAHLLEHGLDGAAEALRILVNEASVIERGAYLKAAPFERNSARVDHANGYKNKTMLTRLGSIDFAVPQVRASGFYPSALEKGSRSEQAMNLALAEMYVQGVSTRRVITVLQSLLGPEISISSTQISRCTEKLDNGLEAWRNRSLGGTPYVVLDARYEKVRTGGQVVDCAVPQFTQRRWALTKQASVACWAYRWHSRRPRCIGEPFWRVSPRVGSRALSTSSVMTMRACVRHAARCCHRCRGSRISQKSAVSSATERQQVRHPPRWPGAGGAHDTVNLHRR